MHLECFSMEESTVLLFIESKDVVSCLMESLATCSVRVCWNLRPGSPSRMCIFESADFTTHLSWRKWRCHVVEWGTCLDPERVEEPCNLEEALAWNAGKANLSK